MWFEARNFTSHEQHFFSLVQPIRREEPFDDIREFIIECTNCHWLTTGLRKAKEWISSSHCNWKKRNKHGQSMPSNLEFFILQLVGQTKLSFKTPIEFIWDSKDWIWIQMRDISMVMKNISEKVFLSGKHLRSWMSRFLMILRLNTVATGNLALNQISDE